jgi:hypothetical protein
VRIWFDTEFIEDGKTIDLLSIGLVREDGRELYLENSEADSERASLWVRENVIPHLRGSTFRRSRAIIASEVAAFAFGIDPEFWADFCAYDWVVLCQLYGTMMQIPQGWPMFCLDVRQLIHFAGGDKMKLPQFVGRAHNALDDARYCRLLWEHLTLRRAA